MEQAHCLGRLATAWQCRNGNTLFCSRGPWTRTSGLQPITPLESAVTADMGTCLLQSRAHSTCSAALWGKRSPSPARAVTSSGRGKGKAGHSSQLCQSSSGSPATTHKPFPNPHPFKLPVGLPAHIYAQVCSKSTCPLPQLIHLFPAPLQFALTQVQDTAPVPGTIQCQTTLQPSYNLTRVPSSISGAAQQLCSLSPTS